MKRLFIIFLMLLLMVGVANAVVFNTQTDFEEAGQPSDWYLPAGTCSTAGDYDETTAPIDGSESIRLQSGGWECSAPNLHIPDYTATDHSMMFRINVSSISTDFIASGSYGFGSARLRTGADRIICANNGADGSTASTINTGEIYTVWLLYEQSTFNVTVYDDDGTTITYLGHCQQATGTANAINGTATAGGDYKVDNVCVWNGTEFSQSVWDDCLGVVAGVNDTINLTGLNPSDGYQLNITSTNINTSADLSESTSCSLIVNDTINQTDTYGAGASQTVNFTIDFGLPEEVDIEYYINCSDSQTTEATSTQTMSVDTATSFSAVNIDINNFNFSSSDYVNVTIFEYNTTVVQDLSVIITTNVLKQSAGGDNDVYVRLIDDNNTLEEKLLRTVSTIGDYGVTGNIWNIPDSEIDNHTMTLQVRRTGAGIVGLENIDFTIITDRTSDSTTINSNVSHVESTFQGTTFSQLYNLTLQSLGYDLFGFSLSSVSASASDTVVRGFSDGDTSNYTASRDVDTDTGTMLFMGNLSSGTYGAFTGLSFNNETISYHDESAIFEMGDTYRPIHHILNKRTGNYTDTINVFPSQKLFTESFTPEDDSILIMYQASYNFTSATVNISLDVENTPECNVTKRRTYSGERGNLFFVKQCSGLTPFEEIEVNISIETGVATESALFDDTLFIASSKLLDTTVEPDTIAPNITVTYPTVNNNSVGWVNGTCTDNGVITGLTINDSNFNNTGSFEDWSFEFIGNTSGEYSVFIQCIDFSGNQDNTTLDLFVDIVVPSCDGLSTQDLDYNATYTWNSTCTDDENLYSLNISCSNGYEFNTSNINDTTYLFNETSTNWNTTGSCTLIVCDAHTKKDITAILNEFTVDTETTELKIKGKKIFEIDEDMGNHLKKMDLDFNQFDRIKFQFEALDTDNAPYNYVVHINPDNMSVDKIYSSYLGHFVIDGYYWLDFQSDDIYDYEEYRINDNHWVVRFSSNKKKVKFNSLGIINCNTYSQTFNVAEETVTYTKPTEIREFESTQQALYWIFLTVLWGVAWFLSITMKGFHGRNVMVLIFSQGLLGIFIGISWMQRFSFFVGLLILLISVITMMAKTLESDDS